MQGRDVVGLAQTGTGKTAAFALPLLQRLNRTQAQSKARPVRVLILSPTRELAAQIQKSIHGYSRKLALTSTCIFGGVSAGPQRKALARGVDILVATPGRLLDLADQGVARLDQVETLVLDEADHMLDIGFMPAIKRVLALVPAKRQTLLFSATMPKEIRQLSARHLNQPVEVSVTPVTATADKINQSLMHVNQPAKIGAVVAVAKDHPGKRILVFTRTKRGADKVSRQLNASNIGAAAIHGNKSQGQRERALAAFRKGDCPVLIATDIAARGIDVPDVAVVINFDMPNVAETYVHRIGRTARAGASGQAVSLCSPDETGTLRAIERLIHQQITVVAPPEGIAEAAKSAVSAAKAARPAKKPGRPKNRPNNRSGNRPAGNRPANAKRSGPPRRRRRSSGQGTRAA